MQRKIKHIISESTFFIFSFYFSRGLRMATALAAPVLIGLIFNQLELGLLASSGALVAGIGDSPGTLKIKLNSQLIGAVFYFLTLLITQFLFPYKIAFGIWAPFCGFFFSMFFIYGNRAVNIAISSLLCLVNGTTEYSNTLLDTAVFMSGVLIYGIISIGLWRIQPYRVIEQRISENLKYLSEYIDLINQFFLISSNSSKDKNQNQRKESILNRIFEKQEKIHTNHEDLRDNLFKLRINAKSFSTRGRRMILTFNSLIDLYEQFISLNLQDEKLVETLDKTDFKDQFSDCLLSMKNILDEMSWSINLHKKINVEIDTSILKPLKEKILYLENNKIEIKGGDINTLKHLRFMLKSFYKQTQMIKSIINEEFNIEKEQTEDLDLEKFTKKYDYDFSKFKYHLNLRSNIFRHSLRVSLAILLSFVICTFLEINYFSWVLLTIVLILKPVYGNTKTASIKRLKGTIIGGIITIIILLCTQNNIAIFILIFISIIGAYSFIPINYKIGVAFVTIFVILLIFLEKHGESWTDVYHRIGGTAIAIVIAFILSFSFLPTWEYKILPTLIRKLLSYNLKYFENISNNLVNETKITPTDLKLSRKDVLLGTSNLSGAFQRTISEPRLSQEYISDIYTVQTLINLLSTRISSLRSYSSKEYKIHNIDYKLIDYIEDTFNNCIIAINNPKTEPDNKWLVEEINLHQNEFSLVTYQLKEINNLIQEIYKYILKIRNYKEWNDYEAEFD